MEIVQWLTVFVAMAGLIALWVQVRLQNKLNKAQLLRDRFETYWRTYEPVTPEQVDEFKMNTYDYIDDELYHAKYEGDEKLIKKYIMMAQLYEYLAFVHALQRLKLEDPLGLDWLILSVRHKLKSDPDHVFHDISGQFREYYPAFDKFVTARQLEIDSNVGR
jgi:hypothetical protein